VQEILADLDDVHFTMLSSQDVVRHKLVSQIVDAYARYDARQAAPSSRFENGAASGQVRRAAGRRAR
jgi:phosphate starvation-inducible PhoH-like protein